METLYDLVSRVLDARDGYNDPASIRRGLRSAIWGADQVTQRHAWNDYHTEATHALNAPVEATVSIDASGKLTRISGTFPEWMNEASVKIDHTLYVVASRASSDEAKLDNYSGVTVASVEVSIVHDRIVLRDNVRHIYEVRNPREDTTLIYVGPASFLTYQTRQNGVASEPSMFTTARTSQPGSHRTELRVSPPPASATTLRIAYYRVARKATVMHDCGTIEIGGQDHNEVTITKPIQVKDYPGLVLVLSGNDSLPDASLGFSVADANPSIDELLVESIESTTRLRLVSQYAELSNRGAMLTQQLDLPPHAMEAAAMYAEAKYLQVGNGSGGDYWQAVQMADAELRTAMEQESTLSRQHTPGSRTAVYTLPEKIAVVTT